MRGVRAQACGSCVAGSGVSGGYGFGGDCASAGVNSVAATNASPNERIDRFIAGSCSIRIGTG